jgi:hypothetical protein
MERKKEVVLGNTTPENALQYLYDRLKRIHNESFDAEPLKDGTVYQYSLYVYPVHSNKIKVTYSTAITPKGDVENFRLNWEMYPAMSFEGLQLQKDTVLIKAECKHPFFMPFFDNLWADMLRDFGVLQPANLDQKKRERIVKLPFATAKDEIEKCLGKRELELKLSIKSYPIERPEGLAYDVSHAVYGEFGQLSIHNRTNETRIRFTRPMLPKDDEATEAYVKAGYKIDVPKNSFAAVDWLFQKREKENEAFYNDFLMHLENILQMQADKEKSEELPKAKGHKLAKKGGRPQLLEDEWAHEQIFDCERTPDEVYPEWLEKVKANPKRRQTTSQSLNKQWNERIKNPNWTKPLIR